MRMLPQDVTRVVITHPHGDHYPVDWETDSRGGSRGSDIERLEQINRVCLLELVDGEQEIALGVTMLPAPGESPEHQVMRLESKGEVFSVLGDIVHHACEVEHVTWGPPHGDLGTLMITRNNIFASVVKENALLVTAHGPFPPLGHIVMTGNGYRCTGW